MKLESGLEDEVGPSHDQPQCIPPPPPMLTTLNQTLVMHRHTAPGKNVSYNYTVFRVILLSLREPTSY